VGVRVRFEAVVKCCWEEKPERRPEFDVIRRNIHKFYRQSGGDHDDYYSSDQLARPPPPPVKKRQRNH